MENYLQWLLEARKKSLTEQREQTAKALDGIDHELVLVEQELDKIGASK